MDEVRQKRVGEEIRQVLSEAILFNMQDPRLPAIFTISGVKVARDFRNATVYFTQIPDDEESIDATLEVLEHARGFLTSQVAQNIRMKFHPRLDFRFDKQAVEAEKIERALRAAHAKDRALAEEHGAPDRNDPAP